MVEKNIFIWDESPGFSQFTCQIDSPGKTEAVIWKEPRSGDICPLCNQKKLDYDGTLNLVCPDCGIVSSGCFT